MTDDITTLRVELGICQPIPKTSHWEERSSFYCSSPWGWWPSNFNSSLIAGFLCMFTGGRCNGQSCQHQDLQNQGAVVIFWMHSWQSSCAAWQSWSWDSSASAESDKHNMATPKPTGTHPDTSEVMLTPKWQRTLLKDYYEAPLCHWMNVPLRGRIDHK